MKPKFSYLLATVLFAFSASATGLGVSVPLVGRLVGGGGVQYITALDVVNNTGTATRVDLYIDGLNLRTQTPIVANASIGSGKTIVARGTGGSMPANSIAHFDDIVDALGQAGIVTNTIASDGFQGSILVVFNGFTKSGQGGVTARFYNTYGDGTVGVALRGHEVTQNEPQKISATVTDTRNASSGPKLYSNVFINNTGLTPAGAPGGPVDIAITAVSGTTGQPVGGTVNFTGVGPGRTVTFGDAVHAFSANDTSLIITARVTSGNAAIAGIVSVVDAATKDGSVFEMSRADF